MPAGGQGTVPVAHAGGELSGSHDVEAEEHRGLYPVHTHTQNAAYSGRDFKPSFSPKFFRENRME